MSLLKQDAVHADDASAHGEELAKGSGNFILASIIAVVVFSAALGAFFWFNHKPPLAAGEVTRIWVHPVHTISKPHDAAGVELGDRQFDQVLVFSSVRFRNQSDQTIVVKDALTNVRFEDGIHSSYAASATDYDRIFVAYPQLSGLKSKTLVADTTVAPGQVIEGMVVSSFHVTKEQWDAHKEINIQIEFRLHPSLILTPVGNIIEQ